MAAASLVVLKATTKPSPEAACAAYCDSDDKLTDDQAKQQYEPSSTPSESDQTSPAPLLSPYRGLAPSLTVSSPRKLTVSYLESAFSNIKITRDIAYKYTANKTMDPEVTNPVTLRLNTYEPTQNTNTDKPLVIFVYGGGMCVGDRLQQEQSAIAFARYGFVTATIDYRMRYDLCGISDGTVDEEDIPAYYAQFISSIQDVAQDILDAKSYLVNRSSQYGLNSSKVGIVGWSVGGTTSEAILLNTFDNQRAGIAGIVTMSGFFPVDPASQNPAANLGTLSSQRPLPAVQAISHDIDAGFRGVDADAGRDCTYVRSQGVSCTYVELPGEGHPLDAYDHVLDIVPFLKQSLGL